MLSTTLSLIDLFGRPVIINFAGRQKFTSNFGGLCSLVFFIFVGWATYIGGKDLVSRDNPTSLYTQSFMQDPLPMTLTKNNFPIAVGIQGPNTMNNLPYLDESIYTIDFILGRLVRTTLENGTVNETWTETPLNKKICTGDDFGELAPSFAILPLDTVYCLADQQPELDEVRIQGVYSSPLFETLLIRMYRCKNGTSPIPCATPEKQEEFLSRGWFNLFYANMAVDPKNFERPDLRFREIYGTMISPTGYKDLRVILNHVSVTTDSGWLVADSEAKEYIQIGQLTESTEVGVHPLGMLLGCSVQVGKLQSQYFRSYTKVQDLLAQVGGLANAALVVIFVVSAPYISLKFRESLINELFDIYRTPKKRSKSYKKTQKGSKENFTTINSKIQTIAGEQEKKTEAHMNRSEVKLDLSKSNQGLLGVETLTKKHRSEAYTLAPGNGPGTPSSPLFPISPTSMESSAFVKRESRSPSPKIPSGAPPKIKKKAKTTTWQELHDYKDKESQKIEFGDLELSEEKHDRKKSESSSLGPNCLVHKEKEIRLDQKVIEENSIYPTYLSVDQVDQAESVHPMRIEQKVVNDNPIYPTYVSVDPIDRIQKTKEIDLVEEYLEEIHEEEKQDKKETPKAGEIVTNSPKENIKIVNLETTEAAQIAQALNASPYKINLSFWEYLGSFFYKSDDLREKLEILDEGMKHVDTRLDVISILKKLREVDKMKVLLLNTDQVVLFNNLPKPEIRPNALRRLHTRASPANKMLKNTAFLPQEEPADLIIDSYQRVKGKSKKTKIDDRLLEVFKAKLQK